MKMDFYVDIIKNTDMVYYGYYNPSRWADRENDTIEEAIQNQIETVNIELELLEKLRDEYLKKRGEVNE